MIPACPLGVSPLRSRESGVKARIESRGVLLLQALPPPTRRQSPGASVFCYGPRMLDPAPKLFDRVPRGLFGPLGDPYSELYWEFLANLYQQEFEREPFVVVRPVALEVGERVIRSSPLWALRRQELEALASEHEPGASTGKQDPPPWRGSGRGGIEAGSTDPEAMVVRTLARRILTRLERSGWVHFQYRSGTGEIMSFHPYAARLLETLLKIARDEQPVFQGYIHSIAALLEPRAFAQRPGVSLSEAKRHTLELVRELKILERNIHLFTQRVLEEAATVAAVLEEGLERYEHAVMANYHRLKTVENVYRQRSAVLERLDAIERDEPSLEAAAEWYATQRAIGSPPVVNELRAAPAFAVRRDPSHRGSDRHPQRALLGGCAVQDPLPPAPGSQDGGTAPVRRGFARARRCSGIAVRCLQVRALG